MNLIQIRKQLHQHPELSSEEEWTKNFLMNLLKKNTRLEIHSFDRWFYAAYRCGSDKNIAFRADFDAIAMAEGIDIPHASVFENIAHKCGHDGHAAALIGLALEVDQNGADQNVFFLFQHGEERGQGAIECQQLIDLENIQAIYAFHNMSGLEEHGIYLIDDIAHYASTGMTINFTGKSSHASEPENGNNPSQAISQLIMALEDLNEGSQTFSTVVHVSIGQAAFGISPGSGKIMLTLRSKYETDLNNYRYKVDQYIQELSKAHHLSYAIEYIDYFPETRNHKESVDVIRQICKKEQVPVYDLETPYRASEDFGYYLKKTKGAIFYIGNGYDYPNIHTSDYDFNDHILPTAVTLFKKIIKATS